MKKQTKLFFTLLLFMMYGCKDREEAIVKFIPLGWGEASMYINGEYLDGIPNLMPHNDGSGLYYFDIRKYNSENFLRRQLDINAIPYNQIVSKQKITLSATNFQMYFDTTNAIFTTFKSHGDVVTGSYTIIENDTIQDYVQFLDIDSTTGEVNGVFQGSFAVPEGLNPSLSGYGDTIILRSGVFHTKIQ
jgi:hypothetical protein